MPPPVPLADWELPKLRYSFSFEDDKRYFDDVGLDTDFFDVKFYPYSPAGSNPVFAAVSKRQIFICRLLQLKDKDVNPCEIIRIIRDDDDGALNCSCTWARDPETMGALLCVAGRDAKVKVYNIREGVPVTSFVGHGGEINDLATSPANPSLIASASDDTTVRIWSLDPVHKRQPCVCLLAGEGHSWNLLSVAFHDTGRYILSAGHDQVINLWTLADVPQEHMATPNVVHYPHFSTSEIHTGLIDCVAFFGDLILSRACHEDVIVLWRIEGFSSQDDPPSAEEAPSNHDTSKLTRSAFSSSAAVAAGSEAASAHPLYTRLLQLHTPGCGSQFFTRFGFFNVAGHHPTLAFCNTTAKIFFWDFACFSAYQEFITAVKKSGSRGGGGGGKDEGGEEEAISNTTGIPRPRWLRLVPPKRRLPNVAGNGIQANTGLGLGLGLGGHVPSTRRGDSVLGGRLREASHNSAGLGPSGTGLEASDKDSSIFSTAGAAAANGGSGGGGGGGVAQSVGTPDPDSISSVMGAAAGTGAGTGAGAAGRGGAGAIKTGEYYNVETLEDWHRKFDTSDPHAQVKAHKTEVASKGLTTMGRQVAWSPEGDWCVVVGSNSRVLVLQRWSKSEGQEEA